MIRFGVQRHPEINILVVGDFMIDCYLYSTVSRMSPEAPVPVAKVNSIQNKAGGAGNVALNITALGSRARALTCIGMDKNGDELLRGLQAAGVDTTYVYRDHDRKTSRKTRIVAQNQQLLRYDEERVEDVSDEFLSRLIKNADEIYTDVHGVILSDYGKGVLTPAVTQFMIQQARSRDIPVFVDPKGDDYKKYQGALVCTPNMKELAQAAGVQSLDTEEGILSAALEICDKADIGHMLVTRSEKGMSLVSRGSKDKTDFPALAQEVCDVTGAGDTVVSVFSVCMAAGYPIDICCRIANTAAAIVVSKFSAETVSIEEINEALFFGMEEEGRKEKICSQEQIAGYAEHLRRRGKRIVFTNGCFDLVHAGHIASFRQARTFGDVLIVGVNSDASVRRLKGASRPIVTLENRMRLLESLELIDYVVPFDGDTPQALIEAIRPDVLVKGKDWEGKTVAGEEFLASYGGQVRFAELEQGLSTTAIVAKIMESNR